MKPNYDHDYIFLEYTMGLCSTCMDQIPSKIILKGERVYILKNCPTHGQHEELIEEHAEFYLKRNQYLKPGTKSVLQTTVNKGCPYDCGICPEHHQHTCIGLIEVTQTCNMACPVCYANGSEQNSSYLSMEKIEEMMDFLQASEHNQAEILQISGGEPTLHPKILDIIQMAKDKNFGYIMLNTNGKRLAEDEDFAKTIASFRGNFEVYLQFDGLKETTYDVLRGSKSVLQMKQQAFQNIKKHKIPTTLVATIYPGINDDDIANIVNFGLGSDYIRGINFQPVAYFGRHPEIDDLKNRITLTGILERLEKQSNQLFTTDDFISLPCNVDKIAVSYFYRSKKGFVSVTKNANIKSYLPLLDNTLNFKVEDFIDNDSFKIGMCDCLDFVKDLKKVIPKGFLLKSKEEKMQFVDENTFRITVSGFIDKYNFDIKSQQRECVHIITDDLKKIPFSTYNMIYRNQKKEASHV